MLERIFKSSFSVLIWSKGTSILWSTMTFLYSTSFVYSTYWKHTFAGLCSWQSSACVSWWLPHACAGWWCTLTSRSVTHTQLNMYRLLIRYERTRKKRKCNPPPRMHWYTSYFLPLLISMHVNDGRPIYINYILNVKPFTHVSTKYFIHI